MRSTMRPMTLALAALVLPLAACGSDEPASVDGGLTTDEVMERAQEAGAEIKPEPGLYRSQTEIQDIQIANAPEQMRDMMKNSMTSQTHEYCLTPEQAEKGFEESARQSQADSNCTFQKFDVDGGSIDAAMTCSPDGQGTMTVAVQGTGSATRSEMNMTMEGDMPPMGSMTMKMRIVNERIGDCPA